MYFLGPLLQWLEEMFSGSINHFPLVELLTFSMDKTIFYMIGMAILQGGFIIWRKYRNKNVTIDWFKEAVVFIFFTYMVLLIHLTVLRYDWKWWADTINLTRPLDDIELTPLIDTIKLIDGDSQFSYWYNFFGNVVWFIPFGLIVPYLINRKHAIFITLILGLIFSIGIETMQFFLETGVSHIDDVIFNGAGVILGYLLYDILKFGNMYLRGDKHIG